MGTEESPKGKAEGSHPKEVAADDMEDIDGEEPPGWKAATKKKTVKDMLGPDIKKAEHKPPPAKKLKTSVAKKPAAK